MTDMVTFCKLLNDFYLTAATPTDVLSHYVAAGKEYLTNT